MKLSAKLIYSQVALLALCQKQILAFTHNPLASKTQSNRSYHNRNQIHSTPELDKIVTAFSRMPDEKLRYKQLMFLSQKLGPMQDSLKTAENKVPGCLSTVFVHATLDDDGLVQYTGDSDGLLTKGLVALLVR